MQRRNLQHPGLQTRVDEITHPSLCTGNPYSQDMRYLLMFIRDNMNNEENPAVRNMIAVLRHNHIYPSSVTTRRWELIQEEHGDLRPCRRNGNVERERMTGPDLVYLALYRVAFPKCTMRS